ncbi:glycosyl transferase family 39 [Planomonospora sphaerica]|uniref:Glycosyl transferase family 39 n=1 Tax=Planomonospora sphaerica TaxID=161355 RepID=A0A161LLD9_9ACTN|nr:glycosyl transferase family 39 [Planomonospora sphaerica]
MLLAYAAGWLPWFYYALADNRTMFMFYAIPMVPFMILALVLAAGLVIGPVHAPPKQRMLGVRIAGAFVPLTQPRRMIGAGIVGAFVLLALLNFWYLYPVLTAESIPYAEWHARMFFQRWI